MAAIAAAYFVAARLGFTLAFVAEQVTTVWPAAGIALGAVIIFGYRVWPGILAGALLANLTANEPLPVAGAITLGNTLEALAGAWLLRRVVGFDRSLERIRDVLGLVVLAALGSTLLAATIGSATLCAAGLQPWSAFRVLWLDWWLGDALGDLLVAPAILTWPTWRRVRWPARRGMEAAAAFACLVIVTAAVFGGRLAVGAHPLEYTIFPVLIWIALRFGQPGTAVSILAASTLAISGTVSGFGPFAGTNSHESLVLLQVFNGVMGTTALLLGAAMAERATRERRRAADYAITQVLAEARTLPEAAPRILKAFCDGLGWDVGLLWTVDPDAGRLRLVELWHVPWVDARRLEEMSRATVFVTGFGLPGRVWSGARPCCIEDVVLDDNFSRAPAALEAGLHGGMGFPILLREEVVGVIEFFSREIRRPDPDLVQMFATIGGQVGLFMDRQRWAETRARLLESEREARAQAEALSEDLRRTGEAKDEFLAVLGHELRNPLAPMRNALEVLRLRGIDDPQAVRMHTIMERQVKHLARLVDDLLDVSRITRGRIELRRERTDLARLAAAAAEGLQTVFEQGDHRLSIGLPESPMILDVDPVRIEQVLANLLANAARFTPKGGRIDLTLEQEGGDAVIRVRDNGIGITAEKLQRVFDMFTQADRIPGEVRHGLGIGLTLVRRLVELHGGRVVARSDGQGRGSEFEVRLPLSTAAVRPVAPAPEAVAPRQALRDPAAAPRS
jgi:signal transduction histidine kinase/integral membrane sensor domain MASE1